MPKGQIACPEAVELGFEPVRPVPRASALYRLALPGLSVSGFNNWNCCLGGRVLEERTDGSVFLASGLSLSQDFTLSQVSSPQCRPEVDTAFH